MKNTIFFVLSFLIVPKVASTQSFLPVYQAGSGTFVVDYVIGGDIDDEDYFLYQPTDLALDSQDNLFVLDYKGFCIKKFDPEGRHIKTFGRKGEGPGEMMNAFYMAAFPNDQIVIYDFGNNRFSVYDNDGDVFNSAGINKIGWRPISDLHIDRNGNLYMESREIDFQHNDEPSKISVSRLELDTMAETVVDSAFIKERLEIRHGQGALVTQKPFREKLLWGITPAGNIVLANSGNYHMKIYSSDLKLVREFHRETEKTEVTEKDKEDYLHRFEDEENFEWVRSKVEFPKYKPYFEELFIDGEGYLLCQLEGDDEDTQQFDVFSPEGKYINRVTLPRLQKTAILTNGCIYTIKDPEDEDPVVIRYRLE